MVYLYCPRKSDSARELVKWLKANDAPAERLTKPRAVKDSDLVVNWGAGNAFPSTAWVLNRVVSHNKYGELCKLRAKGVPVPDHTTVKPREAGWLARVINHHEAKDLLAGITDGDYYTRFLPVKREFRIHIWGDKSIRAGVKVPRTDHPHPRFRSWTGGWKLDYGESPRYMHQTYRDVAREAIAALGYDFGAVDLGVTDDGRSVVFEVNSAPGLEGNTVVTYGQMIRRAATSNGG